MMRLFVALPLPERVRDRLAGLAGGVPGARWEPPENYHITLRFIGEVDEGMAQDIDEEQDYTAEPNFPVTLEGIGTFGRGDKSRALWAGVAASDPLRHLRDKIESAVVRAGLAPEERKFQPHVTLARLKEAASERVGRFVAERALFREGPFMADRFVLYESTLGKSGSVYTELQSYPLGGWRPDAD